MAIISMFGHFQEGDTYEFGNDIFLVSFTAQAEKKRKKTTV
jgi:hypothetical protein